MSQLKSVFLKDHLLGPSDHKNLFSGLFLRGLAVSCHWAQFLHSPSMIKACQITFGLVFQKEYEPVF